MNIVLVESEIFWENKDQSLEHYDNLLSKLKANQDFNADIIILPEFFSVGFTMNTSLAEDLCGVCFSWVRVKAKELNSAIVGSLPFRNINGECTNRAFFITPDGQEYYYDKRHLFRMAGETKYYKSGDKKCIANYKDWNISLNVCYDLRFPVWSRNIDLSYDLMINIANWPTVRQSALEPLIRARAIENLSFFAFVNRVGKDPNVSYSGGSSLIDFKGNIINPTMRIKDGISSLFCFTLDKVEMNVFRDKFPAWQDADKFNFI